MKKIKRLAVYSTVGTIVFTTLTGYIRKTSDIKSEIQEES